jgi:protein-disulfide isomerase
MDDPAIQTQIDANLHLAHQLGIQGTPAMVVGDQMLPGAMDADELKHAVVEARAAKK